MDHLVETKQGLSVVLGATVHAQQSETEVPGNGQSLLDYLSFVLGDIGTSSAEGFEPGLAVK